MSSPDKPSTPDERLRLLLTEAVEPIQPGPGAEARLRGTIRARRRERDLPKRLRWAGAALGAATLVAGGVFVVAQTGRGDGSSASSASSAKSASSPASGPSLPGASSSGALSYGAKGPLPAAAASPPADAAGGTTADSQQDAGKRAANVPQLSQGGTGMQAAPVEPLGGVLTPSDLDGDHSPDQLTLSGSRLTVTFRGGVQTVTLPQVSAGARVLGVTQLQSAAGARTPVAFIRLGADSVHARDTVVAVVSGKLTVLKLDRQPVVLAVTASQGYACDGSLVVTAATVASYTVNGANLVATGATGGVAKPGSNCSFS